MAMRGAWTGWRAAGRWVAVAAAALALTVAGPRAEDRPGAPSTTAQPPQAPPASARVPRPVLAAPSGERCVEDPASMRRDHPDLLKHQRAVTVRAGIRGGQGSLANCVSCHASRDTGRVTGSADAFCDSCHRYASVKLDCFECHADRAQPALTRAAQAGSSPP